MPKPQEETQKNSIMRIEEWIFSAFVIAILLFVMSPLIALLLTQHKQRRFVLKNDASQTVFYFSQAREVQNGSSEKSEVLLLRRGLYDFMVTPNEVTELEPGYEDWDVPGPPY